VDVRSPGEFAGELLHMPDYPQEGAVRGRAGLAPDDDVIAYCRIGERSSHTWFVLTHLLGFERVRNYDGPWTEWGNGVRVPIERLGPAGRPGGDVVTDLPTALAEIADDFGAMTPVRAPPAVAREAPTTPGFAGILHAGLDGLPTQEVLAVPDEAPLRLGLGEAVSPLRLRGMVAMLGRIKRQLRIRDA
jgi:hypothetical protein